MAPYCTEQDAIGWLGPGNAAAPYRDLAAVDPDADTLELGGHGFATGDPFEVTAREGTVPGGLALATEYYAIVVSSSRWQAAATVADAAAGIPIDITDAGDNVGVLLHIPWARFIAEEGAVVDNMFIGNAMPVPAGAPVPPLVSRYTAILVAARVARHTGQAAEDLKEREKEAKDELKEIYLKGKPIRNQPTAATNTAVSGARLSGSSADPRGWSSEVLP